MEALISEVPLPRGFSPSSRIGDCPVQRAIGMIADKWKILILIALSHNEMLRFKELQRTLEHISPKVLTSALRALEADGLVERHVFAEIPPRVEYRPAPRARTLIPILMQLEAWSKEPIAAADAAPLPVSSLGRFGTQPAERAAERARAGIA